MRPPAYLGHHEGISLLTQHTVQGNPHIGPAHMGMGILRLAVETVIADNFHAWSIRRHDEHGHAAVAGRLRVGHCHDDEKAGETGI
jgi:hypothetical protein